LPSDFIRLCPWEGAYLFSVARNARVGLVEIGRFNGGSTFLLSCAAPDVPIYSIDVAPQNDARLKQMFAETGEGTNVKLIVGDSQHGQFPSVGPYDVLFIDGDHSYEGCSADIANWYGGLVPNGHLLFHDAARPGVQDAIAQFMTAHQEAHVLVPPFMGTAYWENPHGSIAHFIKR
jgi:predicted O-methyltransferase YrrM